MMTDYISRQDAIDEIRKCRFVVDAIEKIKALPSVEPEPWIPCSERLPEEGEEVLATHLGGIDPNRQVIEHVYQGGGFTHGWAMDMDFNSPTFGKRYMGKVIAWMPKPEPWKGDAK